MNNVVHRRRGRRSHILFGAGVLGALVLLSGCSSNASTSSSSSSVPSDSAAASKVDAPILDSLTGAQKTRVANLILQAQKEGGLNWMDGVVAQTSETQLVDDFKQQYGLPDLKVQFSRTMTGDIATQVQQQVTAGKVTTDLVGVASPDFWQTMQQAGALLKYTSPNASAYANASKYVDAKKGYWVSPFAYAFEPISSPNHYKDTISTWEDLLKPDLAGHISMPDPRSSQAGLYNYIAMRKILPLSYFKKLAAQKPILSTGGSIQDTQAVASGQILTSITSGFRALQTVAQTGAPITVSYPKDGVIMIGQSYGIIAKSPDPAAAELFEDYLLSKEGLQKIVNLEGVTPTRSGITVSANVKKYAPASLSDVKVIPMDYEKITQSQLDDALAEWKSVFLK